MCLCTFTGQVPKNSNVSLLVASVFGYIHLYVCVFQGEVDPLHRWLVAGLICLMKGAGEKTSLKISS